jgi:hypothetical protein
VILAARQRQRFAWVRSGPREHCDEDRVDRGHLEGVTINVVPLKHFENGGIAEVVQPRIRWFTGSRLQADALWKIVERAEFLLKLQPKPEVEPDRSQLRDHRQHVLSGLAEIMLWGGLAARGPGRRRRPFGQWLSLAARVQGPRHDRCHHPRPPDEDIETIRRQAICREAWPGRDAAVDAGGPHRGPPTCGAIQTRSRQDARCSFHPRGRGS